MNRLLIILTMLLVSFTALRAAENDTTVYFVNVYPGPDIYELEGHSAILVDIRGQRPMAYNFGVFDFGAPNFVYRFVKGETDYMAVEWPWEPFLAPYAAQGRRVVAHELNFDSHQKARLVDLLKENVKPENSVYRYKYVKDNCATRPLRAVELAAGDSLMLAPAPIEANSSMPITFRNVMRHYHHNYPWYQFGIDLALGSGIDYPLTRRELAFAPAELDRMLPNATAGGKPLVKSTRAVIDLAPDNAVCGPTPWYATPMTVCCLILALAAALTIRDIRRGRVTRWFDALLFGIYGIMGLLLTFLIFISVHEATSPNWIYLWLNPLCLCVPILIWIKRAQIVLIWYQIANFAVLLLLLALWPLIPQSANPAFLPLVGAGIIRAGSYVFITLKQKRTNR